MTRAGCGGAATAPARTLPTSGGAAGDLDRLIGALAGSRIPGMEVWDEEDMSLASQYAALAG